MVLEVDIGVFSIRKTPRLPECAVLDRGVKGDQVIAIWRRAQADTALSFSLGRRSGRAALTPDVGSIIGAPLGTRRRETYVGRDMTALFVWFRGSSGHRCSSNHRLRLACACFQRGCLLGF